MHVLIANAKSPPALAVIRSLGKKGYLVTGASDERNDFPMFSKYCKKRIYLKSGQQDPDQRIDELLAIVADTRFDAFLPIMSESMLLALARRRAEFENHTRLVLPSFEQLSILNNKAKVWNLLDELGHPRPVTYFAETQEDLDAIRDRLEFPLVIKPFRGEGARGVRLIHDPGEMDNTFRAINSGYGPVLIQKFVTGVKHTAVYLLNRNSEPKRFFVHRAIREYPVTGGPTCFLTSVKYEPVFEYGLGLLRKAGFTGLAAMEFIIDSTDGMPKIIDVNPRIYGPIQCAIAAGVDLPSALVEMTLNGDIEADMNYREGVTCRNLLFEDAKHMISILKGVKSPKYNTGKVKAILNFLNFFRDDSYFVLSLSDPLPALMKIFRSK
jgi:predicted ATP-grasp superfamily ATP-dependent carboligase